MSSAAGGVDVTMHEDAAMSCVRRSLPNDEMSREGCQTDQIRCDEKLQCEFAEGRA